MDDPAARRARLKEIREAANASGEPSQPDGGPTGIDEATENKDAPITQETVLKFRNYAVRDEKIEHEKVEAAHAPEFEEIKVDLDAVIVGDAPEEVIINVAPKKANWDLRRDIAVKLAKLERQTQRAIIELAGQEEERRQREEGAAA